MRVSVLFFGVLRDATGTACEAAELPEGATVNELFRAYSKKYPVIAGMASSILLSRNRAFAKLDDPLRAGDEVAFLPPVSGGMEAMAELSAAGNYFALTRRPIDVHAISTRLIGGAEGAVVTFEGTVRNNSGGRRTRFLEYEAYEPMALQEMLRIGSDLTAARNIGRIAMVHRLGRMLIGETAVTVVVTAPHRRPAFEAALEGIDRLKKTVPIWKKEYFVDGEVWAPGEWRPSDAAGA